MTIPYADVITTGFFEDCIAEEQFEAQKLDIMRDAVRAKATYTTSTKNMTIHESPEPPSPNEPLSPVTKSPMPASPIPPETETAPNGAAATSRNTDASESVGAVANGESLEGSEVIANGNADKSIEVSEVTVIANGDADNSVKELDGVTNGDSSHPESKIANGHDEVTNGVPETV